VKFSIGSNEVRQNNQNISLKKKDNQNMRIFLRVLGQQGCTQRAQWWSIM